MEHFTDIPTMLCTFLSFFIPYTVSKIYNNFSHHTNPPWKKEEN